MLRKKSDVKNIKDNTISPLKYRAEIVPIEPERKPVEANRDLIARMEKKIKDKLAEVWGETGN